MANYLSTIHPIGVKVLSPEMMKYTFVHTDSVLQTIETFRKTAAENQEIFNKQLRSKPNDALLMAKGYNNAVSILGSRGIGKTSIIMTLQHILRYGKENWETQLKQHSCAEKNHNIIMPIMVPQDFTPNQTLLSWVIVQLLNLAKEVEKDVQRHGDIGRGRHGIFRKWLSEEDVDHFSDPLRDCMDELQNSFELRYKSSLNPKGEGEHVRRYMDEVRKDASLAIHMLKLISMIIEYYRYIAKDSKENEEKEPLLVFSIDDLDLAPERSQEVLNLVLRYLQHPNVVVLCGWNQELFQSHLTMEVLRHQGALDAGLLDVNGDYIDVFLTRQRKKISLLDSARRLSMDNLKKAFPPAYRFEIRGLRARQRACFPNNEMIESASGDHPEISLLSLIEKALLASRKDPMENRVDFLRDQDELLYIYGRIFDNKSRGLINVYNSFESLQTLFSEWNRKEPLNLTGTLQALVDSILFSNTRFIPYRKGIRDLIRIDSIILQAEGSAEKDICNFYCDYQRVKPVLQDYKRLFKAAKEKTTTDANHKVESEYNYFPFLIIDAFLLLNFMQNVFRYICGLAIYEHGGRAFSEALNELIPAIELQHTIDNDMLSCAILSAGIEKIHLFPETDNFRVNLLLLNAYEKHDFWDGQYDFTGSHSYCRMSIAITEIISNGKTEKATDGARELPVIDKEKLSEWKRAYPDWMNNIQKLFTILGFTQENTERLARYRCYSLQDLYQDENELVRDSNFAEERASRKMIKNIKGRPKGEEGQITDQDSDKLVSTIRTVEELLNVFKNYKKNNNKNGTNIQKNRDAIVKLFENIFPENIPQKTWVDTTKYNEIIFGIKNTNKSALKQIGEDKEQNERAIMVLQEIKTLLKWNLKARLDAAFLYGMGRRIAADEQYAYTLKASGIIPEYLRRWNLGTDENLGGAEENALNDILEKIDRFRNDPIYLKVDAIQDAIYEDELSSTERDSFLQTLNELIIWIRKNRVHFTSEEQSQINHSIRVLRHGLIHLRLRNGADREIFNIVKELGQAIAEKSAGVSFKNESVEDKSSTEISRTSWPIVKSTRSSFDNWQTVKEAEKNRKPENGYLTLFTN